MSSISPALVELYRRDFLTFRANLLVDGPKNSVFKVHEIQDEVQIADAEAMAPALEWAAGRGDEPVNTCFWLQRARGRSKTTDIAIALLYVELACKKKLTIVVVADDKDQGKLVLEQAQKVLQHNPWLHDFVGVQRNKIINKQNDATITFLARDTFSSFGLTPDMVVCDEFTHWTREDMWDSVYTSWGKKEGPLIISCNAGYGVDWKYRMKREAMEKHGKGWYHSAPEGPAPWLSQERLEAFRRSLSPEVFDRLYLNHWQAGAGEFVTLAEADACVCKDRKKVLEAPSDGRDYVAAIDYAHKHDRTVGVVGHIESGKIVIDRMDVIDPRLMPEGICRVEWVENWMHEVWEKYAKTAGIVDFVVDRWQLIGSIQRVKDSLGCYIEEFEFKSGIGNWEIAYILRHLILHQKIEWYEGCGEIRDKDGNVHRPRGQRDDLGMELSSLLLKPVGQRFRFDHGPSDHDDRAFAVGAMARYLIHASGGYEFWDLAPPTADGKFQIA